MDNWVPLIVMAFACGMVLALVSTSARESRRLNQRDATAPVAGSTGHVLYLRAFREDDNDLRTMEGLRREEYLEQVFREIGPMLAVGKPGEVRPPLGAQRVYFDDDEWQREVLGLIQGARMIVVAADITDGLRWELQQLVAHAQPHRVVVALPYGRAIIGPVEGAGHRARRAKVYEAFRVLAAGIFPYPFPNECPYLAFLGFAPDWRPLLLPAPAGWKTWVLGQTPFSRVGITETLRPHLMRQGIELPRWRTVVRGLLFFPFMGILQSLAMIFAIVALIITIQVTL